jgi:hypothetical protein
MFSKFVLVVFVLIAPVSTFAQQDSTVEWKLSLQDLERRLAGVSNENAADVEAWRVDAEDLRASLASFAAAHADMRIEVPESLPENSTTEAFKDQLDRLTTAVDLVIKQSPGSPFHLGTVNVVVSAENSTPALVADSIDQTSIDQHDFLNIAKAFDYLPGVEIEHIATRNEAGIRLRGFTTVTWDEFAIFQILEELEKQGHWVAVRDLCEEQIQKTPEWLTPYLCAGVAHPNLGESFSSPVLHAWNSDDDGFVVDTTWHPLGIAYFGVVIPRALVLAARDERVSIGSSIDNWRQHWPLLRRPWSETLAESAI